MCAVIGSSTAVGDKSWKRGCYGNIVDMGCYQMRQEHIGHHHGSLVVDQCGHFDSLLMTHFTLKHKCVYVWVKYGKIQVSLIRPFSSRVGRKVEVKLFCCHCSDKD